MKNSTCLGSGQLLIGRLAVLPVGVSVAALDEFHPYAFARVVNDSNVFRVSGDQEAISVLGGTSRDDTISYLGAGLTSDLKLSRQHLYFDLDLSQASYDNFSDLDHTRIDGRAAWGWRIGNLWRGNLGYDYKKELSSFNERSTPQKDMKTKDSLYFDGGYQIHPDWELVGALRYSGTSYQDRDQRDRDGSGGHIEVRYRNTLNTRLGLRARYTDYDLKEEQDISGMLISNDYKETEISGVFYWEGTAKSSLEARLGYTDLTYNDFNDRDYQGSSGKLTYFWVMTGKTRMDIDVWQETSTQSDEITTYVLSKGFNIRPAWSVTRKITLRGQISYTNDDFKGENDIRVALGDERREDDTLLYGITATWTPRAFLNLSIGYRNENRDSSVKENDFDDNQVEARIRLQLP